MCFLEHKQNLSGTSKIAFYSYRDIPKHPFFPPSAYHLFLSPSNMPPSRDFICWERTPKSASSPEMSVVGSSAISRLLGSLWLQWESQVRQPEDLRTWIMMSTSLFTLKQLARYTAILLDSTENSGSWPQAVTKSLNSCFYFHFCAQSNYM